MRAFIDLIGAGVLVCATAYGAYKWLEYLEDLKKNQRGKDGK